VIIVKISNITAKIEYAIFFDLYIFLVSIALNEYIAKNTVSIKTKVAKTTVTTVQIKEFISFRLIQRL